MLEEVVDEVDYGLGGDSLLDRGVKVEEPDGVGPLAFQNYVENV